MLVCIPDHCIPIQNVDYTVTRIHGSKILGYAENKNKNKFKYSLDQDAIVDGIHQSLLAKE